MILFLYQIDKIKNPIHTVITDTQRVPDLLVPVLMISAIYKLVFV